MTPRFFAASLALSSALAFSSQPAFAQHRGSYAGGGGHGGHGGGYAVPRGGGYTGGGYHGGSSHGGGYNGGGYYGGGGAAYRHPRAGTGSGYYYGSYYGHSHGYYGHGYYPYSRYYGGYYPYYSYGSYGYPYFGLSFSWGSPSYYSAPQAVSYAAPTYAVGYSDARRDDADDGDVAPARDRDSGWLRVEVRPEDTSVYVDDQFRGTGRETRGLALSPGHHTIELVRPGFVTEQHEVDIASGARSDLLVEMRR